MNKSIFNLNENLAAALSYLIGPFSGLFFFIGETITGNKNKFVRFHALQSTVFFAAVYIVKAFLRLIRWFPFIGFIAGIVDLIAFISLIFLIYMAYTGKNFRIPIIGDVCWDQVNK